MKSWKYKFKYVKISSTVCSCPRGYIGSPFQRCSPIQEPVARPECSSDDECNLNKACSNSKCVDPCSLNTCGNGARCYVQSKSNNFKLF